MEQEIENILLNSSLTDGEVSRLTNELLNLHSVSNSDSTIPTVYTEWNRIIQEIADEECMSIDNRILRHLKTKYHPPIKRSGC